MNMTFDQAKDILVERLSAHRYQHSLNVADLCRQLAGRYGIHVDKAYTAGLLHDCAKAMSDQELIKVCRDNGYEPDDIQIKATQLLHSIAGAFVAKEEFGEEDEDILNSITNHTCGRPNMSNLEMLVFCADYCEVGRIHSDAVVAREMLGKSLEETTLHVLENVITFNEQRGVTVHPASLITRDFYKGLLEGSTEGKR